MQALDRSAVNRCFDKMVMTRGKDDEKALYDLLGNKD